MKMNVKRLRRKCSVRGCGNTGSYVISRTREMGYSVIICRECLEQGLKAVKELETHAKGIGAGGKKAESVDDAAVKQNELMNSVKKSKNMPKQKGCLNNE